MKLISVIIYSISMLTVLWASSMVILSSKSSKSFDTSFYSCRSGASSIIVVRISILFLCLFVLCIVCILYVVVCGSLLYEYYLCHYSFTFSNCVFLSPSDLNCYCDLMWKKVTSEIQNKWQMKKIEWWVNKYFQSYG